MNSNKNVDVSVQFSKYFLDQHSLAAPSILAADPTCLASQLETAEKAGADWHHVDVMDGHFVPNLTFGLPLIKALKSKVKIPLDVHIMISNPDEMALKYVEAGADFLSFHVEASRHPHRLLTAIRQAGAIPGLAINPGTPLVDLEPLLEETSLINVMAVNPGFGGQSFISQSLQRIEKIRDMVEKKGLSSSILIEVDGGVDGDVAQKAVEVGAHVLVAGTYVYGRKDMTQAIRNLHVPFSKPFSFKSHAPSASF